MVNKKGIESIAMCGHKRSVMCINKFINFGPAQYIMSVIMKIYSWIWCYAAEYRAVGA